MDTTLKLFLFQNYKISSNPLNSIVIVYAYYNYMFKMNPLYCLIYMDALSAVINHYTIIFKELADDPHLFEM